MTLKTPGSEAEAETASDDRSCECVDDHGTDVREDGTFCVRCGLKKS